jgi:hypothetical protein
MNNNAMLYGAIIIVAILVFVGAAVAVNVLAPRTYDVSLAFSANNTAGILYPYQTTAFNVVVTNNGGREIVGLPIAFYINGQENNYSSYAIPAHNSITLEEIYTYTQPGTYLFSAAADPGNVLHVLNASAAKKSLTVSVSEPQLASVYSSVPNSNIIKTVSFTTSGTGLLSGSIMSQLYNVTALNGFNGADNGILAKTFQDLYPYISVANGAYSVYSNGTVAYSAWLQGTVTPAAVGVVIGSFNKNIAVTPGKVVFIPLTNTISICSTYQQGWTKIVELYNNSEASSCVGLMSQNYTPSESNSIVTALKATKIGLAANTIGSNTLSWQHFYYNNATVLGQAVGYTPNSISASTLFQLQAPQGIFLSTIDSVGTNVMAVNTICNGLESSVSSTSVCSVALPTSTEIGNQSFGAIYSKFISTNYTATVYSLLSQQYMSVAHENALELISKLNISGSSVQWTTPFYNDCAFDNNTFGCRFDGISNSGIVNVTVTNTNYTSISLSNVTCGVGGGWPVQKINGTLSRGDSQVIGLECHTLPIPNFASETSFDLSLGFTSKGIPMIVNGTANVTTSS